MTFVKSALVAGAALAALTAGTLAASSASAASTTYVVCNAYSECWKVHQKYSDYPADQRIIYRDDAWWVSHNKDTKWHFLADPASDHGWYDKDGAWHAFAPADPN